MNKILKLIVAIFVFYAVAISLRYFTNKTSILNNIDNEVFQ
jgi:hypothetical protein